MDIVDDLILIIETLFSIFIIGSIIWKATSVYKLKGFIISSGSIILIFVFIIFFEKFLNYATENSPILILIMLGIMAATLIGLTVYALMEQAKFSNQKRITFFKEQFKIALKQVAISLSISAVIVGVIFLLIFSSNN